MEAQGVNSTALLQLSHGGLGAMIVDTKVQDIESRIPVGNFSKGGARVKIHAPTVGFRVHQYLTGFQIQQAGLVGEERERVRKSFASSFDFPPLCRVHLLFFAVSSALHRLVVSSANQLMESWDFHVTGNF